MGWNFYVGNDHLYAHDNINHYQHKPHANPCYKHIPRKGIEFVLATRMTLTRRDTNIVVSNPLGPSKF